MQPDPDTCCDECRGQGAYVLDGRALCLDCYARCTATCCADDPEDSRP